MKIAYGILGFAGCSGAPLSVQQVYNLARQAGFQPDTARSMVAIAMRESNLIPNCIATGVAGSTEASYGLWQINMSGSLKVPRMAQFGLSDPSQLLDPAVNASAAFSLSGGGSNLSPWHIDSDTGIVAGKTVNLGYRTKYLANLSSLPLTVTLESGFSWGVAQDNQDGTVGIDSETGEQVLIDPVTGDILGPVGSTPASDTIPDIPTIAILAGAAAAAWLFLRD